VELDRRRLRRLGEQHAVALQDLHTLERQERPAEQQEEEVGQHARDLLA